MTRKIPSKVRKRKVVIDTRLRLGDSLHWSDMTAYTLSICFVPISIDTSLVDLSRFRSGSNPRVNRSGQEIWKGCKEQASSKLADVTIRRLDATCTL